MARVSRQIVPTICGAAEEQERRRRFEEDVVRLRPRILAALRKTARDLGLRPGDEEDFLQEGITAVWAKEVEQPGYCCNLYGLWLDAAEKRSINAAHSFWSKRFRVADELLDQRPAEIVQSFDERQQRAAEKRKAGLHRLRAVAGKKAVKALLAFARLDCLQETADELEISVYHVKKLLDTVRPHLQKIWSEITTGS